MHERDRSQDIWGVTTSLDHHEPQSFRWPDRSKQPRRAAHPTRQLLQPEEWSVEGPLVSDDGAQRVTLPNDRPHRQNPEDLGALAHHVPSQRHQAV